MTTFHWGSLSATACTVAGLLGAAWLLPAPGAPTAAHASFPDPAPKHVANTATGEQMSYEDFAAETLELADMDTAAGPMAQLLDYDLEAVIEGAKDVPRLTLVSLPGDLRVIRETNVRKTVFFKSVLPLVLQVNEQIVQDRARLWKLHAKVQNGMKLPAQDRLWLVVMATRYGVSRDDIPAMLARHDVVPPSLALAQAATESAWGTSRFVREGNAMFGEWTFADNHKGIVPSDRGVGKNHRVRAFDSLYESVLSYVTNLNKHRAYKEFRVQRAAMRAKGQTLDGLVLAGALHRYSERGAAYVSELRTIISTNDLDMLDRAQLSDSDGAFKPLI